MMKPKAIFLMALRTKKTQSSVVNGVSYTITHNGCEKKRGKHMEWTLNIFGKNFNANNHKQLLAILNKVKNGVSGLGEL